MLEALKDPEIFFRAKVLLAIIGIGLIVAATCYAYVSWPMEDMRLQNCVTACNQNYQSCITAKNLPQFNYTALNKTWT